MWERLKTGDIDEETVWEAHTQNLHHALEEIQLLCRNVDAGRLVVTADHGNAMGELGQYGHGRNERVDSVCRVLWEVIDAEDIDAYEPTTEPEREDGSDAEQRLDALGYR